MFAVDQEKRTFWRECADAIKIPLHHERVMPSAVIRVAENPRVWQGLEAIVIGDAASLPRRGYAAGESFILDFGRFVTGKLHLELDAEEGFIHAPVRLRLLFAEHLCEFTDPGGGLLPASWRQEEIVNIDAICCDVELPRRYSFNYLRVEVVCASSPIFFRELWAVSSTGAMPPDPEEISGSEMKKRIDACCIRTLKNCMQTIFEDGPRRDRRLWLGDLRLQALVNSVTFRNAELVDRCLYLLASESDAQGMIPACVFPGASRPSTVKILDYALLLGDVLRFHAAEYGVRPVVRELYPLALHQLEFARKYIGSDGVFHDPGCFWIFIDWCDILEREMAITAVFIYALGQCARLAEMLGDASTAGALTAEAGEAAGRIRRFIAPDGVIRSGSGGQLSHATQVWMILAGVFTPEEGRRALAVLDGCPESVKPCTPYLWHYYVEACFAAGDAGRALKVICGYWGGMIKRGARTFWEVYCPEDDDFSPYRERGLNSSCHAWSCTPAYFFRRKPR